MKSHRPNHRCNHPTGDTQWSTSPTTCPEERLRRSRTTSGNQSPWSFLRIPSWPTPNSWMECAMGIEPGGGRTTCWFGSESSGEDLPLLQILWTASKDSGRLAAAGARRHAPLRRGAHATSSHGTPQHGHQPERDVWGGQQCLLPGRPGHQLEHCDGKLMAWWLECILQPGRALLLVRGPQRALWGGMAWTMELRCRLRWEEPTEQAGEEPSDAAHNNTNDETYYKGKGKSRSTTMGLGCSLCGSKWHNTHSCALREPKGKGSNKGYNRTKGKGYNKGFGKSPYRKGFGKSKGYGKKGKYPHEEGLRQERRIFGVKSFHKTSRTTTVDPISWTARTRSLKRAVSSTSTTTRLLGHGTHLRRKSCSRERKWDLRNIHLVIRKMRSLPRKPPSAWTSPRWRLPMPTTTTWWEETAFAVCWWVLVLPVDSLAQIPFENFWMLAWFLTTEPAKWHGDQAPPRSPASVVQSDDTLARVSLPFVMPDGDEHGVPGNYSADLIGGHGSTCPALLPNTSLRQMRSAVLTQWLWQRRWAYLCALRTTSVLTNLDQSGDPAPAAHWIWPLRVARSEGLGHCNHHRRWEGADQATMDWTTSTSALPSDGHWSRLTFRPNTSTPVTTMTRMPRSCSSSLMQAWFRTTPKTSFSATTMRSLLMMFPTMDFERDINRWLMMNHRSRSWWETTSTWNTTMVSANTQEIPSQGTCQKANYVTCRRCTRQCPRSFTPRRRRPLWHLAMPDLGWRKRKGSKFHFWEWCSGSGRLSLIALLSGLCVLFPIDYRYGWDLSHPEHQLIILEIEQGHLWRPRCSDGNPFMPTMVNFIHKKRSGADTTRARSWTTNHQLHQRQVQEKVQRQEGEHPGATLEFCTLGTPSRPTWRSSTHRSMPLQSTGWDRESNPEADRTLLPTSIYVIALPVVLDIKDGRHGWLQGAVQGMNRTTLAAVYPESLCRSLVKDIKWYINHLNYYENFYKCERCAMGRAATSSMEHSFLPGECRYGKWPEGQDPREKKRLEKEQQEKDDIFETFRRESLKNPKVMQGRLSAHPSFSFNSEQTAVLKMALIKLLSESVDEFEAYDKRKHDHNYVHWLQDPTALSWLKNILKEYMIVEGAMACPQPWSTPTPNPQMTVEEAPLRLLLRGAVESWKMDQIEDLRELSLSQWNSPVNLEEDWMVAIFGKDAEEQPTTSSTSSRSKQPRGPMMWSLKGYDPSIGDELEVLQPPAMEVEEADQLAQNPGSLKPIFDFRRVFTRLPTLAGKDDVTAKRLILGLHERLWHAPYQDIKNILVRCGMPYDVWKLASDAISTCRICRKFARAGRRPQHRGTDLALHFNEVVQVDLFNYGDQQFILIIDEATRYKIATPMWRPWTSSHPGRHHEKLDQILWSNEDTCLGPRNFTHDDPCWSWTTTPWNWTATWRHDFWSTRSETYDHGIGLVEKHIDLIKLTMAKLQAEAGRWELEIEGEELASEASMAANTTHCIGGYSPVTILFGILPRGFLDPEEASPSDGVEPDESAFERALRLRQVALQAVQAAILESRIARANRSRPQQLELGSLVAGTSKVEIFRDDGGGYGWRGPATVLKINDHGNSHRGISR